MEQDALKNLLARLSEKSVIGKNKFEDGMEYTGENENRGLEGSANGLSEMLKALSADSSGIKDPEEEKQLLLQKLLQHAKSMVANQPQSNLDLEDIMSNRMSKSE